MASTAAPTWSPATRTKPSYLLVVDDAAFGTNSTTKRASLVRASRKAESDQYRPMVTVAPFRFGINSFQPELPNVEISNMSASMLSCHSRPPATDVAGRYSISAVKLSVLDQVVESSTNTPWTWRIV